MKVINLNKKCFMVLNVDTNEVLAPFKISGNCWFRAIYDTERAAKQAINKLNEDRWYESFKGNYKVVEVFKVGA